MTEIHRFSGTSEWLHVVALISVQNFKQTSKEIWRVG